MVHVIQIAPIKADVTSNIKTNLEKLAKGIQPFAYAIVALALVVIGLMCLIGGDNGREAAKKSAPAVCIGCMLLNGAVTFGKYLSGIFNFG